MVFSVFLASVVGGLHCAGMCGGLAAFALRPEPGKRRMPPHLLYHGGRGIAYTMLGAITGTFGGVLNSAAAADVTMYVAASVMILIGVDMLLRSQAGYRTCGGRIAEKLAPLAAKVQGKALRMPTTRRALVIGLATPLLPCGWLYAFVITAAGTGSAWQAAIVMAAFWAGTLPAMAAVGVGVQTLFGSLGKRLPAATAVLLVLAGLWTIAGRNWMTPAAMAAEVSAETSRETGDVPPCCREES
jgi:sulfite exporter TauE/SafE